MKTHWTILLVVLVGAGCVTTPQRRVEQARRAQDLELLKADVYRMKEQTGSVSSGYEQIYADIERLRREQGAGDKELADRLEQLELRVRKQEEAITAMRGEIIAELSKKIAALMQSQGPSRSGEYGREHIVKPGQTLSEIASAYGVTVNALVRANGLKNANAIYAGQKLFIPE